MIKRTKVAAAVSAACALMVGQAVAQEAVEEVVVTGIRGSLRQALDLKRETSGVMDAISSEDIGKFPDTNLAESLQRITGVSVNRVEGEGSEVTIRGFGGQFNLVTLNGRQMPAADNAVNFFGINANRPGGNSRSFDFSNIASEGVSGLQVYKSGRAESRPAALAARSMFKPSDLWTWVMRSPWASKPLTTPVATALRRSSVVWAAGSMTAVPSA